MTSSEPVAPITAVTSIRLPSTQDADPVVAAIESKLLTAQDVGPGAVIDYGPMAVPVDCAGVDQNPRLPPDAEVSTGGNVFNSLQFTETVLLYGDEATAAQAFEAEAASVACLKPRALLARGGPRTLGPTTSTNVRGLFGLAEAVEIDYAYGRVFILRAGDEVVDFAFLVAQPDNRPLPDPVAVVHTGMDKLSA